MAARAAHPPPPPMERSDAPVDTLRWILDGIADPALEAAHKDSLHAAAIAGLDSASPAYHEHMTGRVASLLAGLRLARGDGHSPPASSAELADLLRRHLASCAPPPAPDDGADARPPLKAAEVLLRRPNSTLFVLGASTLGLDTEIGCPRFLHRQAKIVERAAAAGVAAAAPQGAPPLSAEEVALRRDMAMPQRGFDHEDW